MIKHAQYSNKERVLKSTHSFLRVGVEFTCSRSNHGGEWMLLLSVIADPQTDSPILQALLLFLCILLEQVGDSLVSTSSKTCNSTCFLAACWVARDEDPFLISSITTLYLIGFLMNLVAARFQNVQSGYSVARFVNCMVCPIPAQTEMSLV